MANPQYNPGQEGVALTASPNLRTEIARQDPNEGVNQLLRALGDERVGGTIKAFTEKSDADTQRMQMMRVEDYAERFRKERAEGTVSATQAKTMFPELSQVVAAHVAESIGRRQGEKDFQSVIDEVNGDDALRLDTAKRNAYIAKRRGEIHGAIPAGNEFYASGTINSMDKLLSQQELKWQGQTAAYHTQVQVEDLSKSVVEALASPDPHAALTALGTSVKGKASLNNLEVNKAVVGTALQTALTARDPKMLDALPQRFLNAESKAEIETARTRIQTLKMQDWRDAQSIESADRETEVRNLKRGIVATFAAGRAFDPSLVAHNPEAWDFAMRLRDTPRVPKSTSAANVQKLVSKIWNDASVGKGMTEEQYLDRIASDPTINADDKEPLMKQVKVLMEGAAVMEDPLVRRQFTDRINPAISQLEDSPAYGLYSMQGRNMRAEVLRRFESDLELSWKLHREENGGVNPIGRAKAGYVKEALAAAEKHITDLMDIRKAAAASKPAATAAPAATPAAPAATSRALPKGVREVTN